MEKINNFKILSIHSHKGGVGKTSLVLATAINLVFEYGKKVIILDADFSGSSFSEIIDNFASVPFLDLKGNLIT